MLEINSSDLVALLLGSSGAKAAAGADPLAQSEAGGAGEFAAELLPLLSVDGELAELPQFQPPGASPLLSAGFWRMAQPVALTEAETQAQCGAQPAASEAALPLRERLLLLLQQSTATGSAPSRVSPFVAEAPTQYADETDAARTLRQALADALASGAKPASDGGISPEQLAASLKAQVEAALGGKVSLDPLGEAKLSAGLAEALAGATSTTTAALPISASGANTVAGEPSATSAVPQWTLVQAVNAQGRQFQLWAAPAANNAASSAIPSEGAGAFKLQIALVEANAQTGAFKPLLTGLLAVQLAPVALSEPALTQPIAVASAAPAAMAEGLGGLRSPAAARQSASILAAAPLADASTEAKPTPLQSASPTHSATTPGELKPAASAERPQVPEPAAQAARQSEASPRSPVSNNSVAASGESAGDAAMAGKPLRQNSVDLQPRTTAAFAELAPALRQFAAPVPRVALPQLAQFIADYAAQADAGSAPRQVVVSVSPPDLGEVVIQLSESANGLDVLLKSGAAGSSHALRDHLPVLAAQLAAADVPVRNLEVAEATDHRNGGNHQGQHRGSGQEQQQSREESRQQTAHQRTPREEMEAAMTQAAESARNHIGLSPFR